MVVLQSEFGNLTTLNSFSSRPDFTSSSLTARIGVRREEIVMVETRRENMTRISGQSSPLSRLGDRLTVAGLRCRVINNHLSSPRLTRGEENNKSLKPKHIQSNLLDIKPIGNNYIKSAITALVKNVRYMLYN